MALPFEIGLIQPSDVADFDYSGIDSVISGNGKIMVTCSPVADHSSLTNPGAAYAYDIVGDKFTNEQKLIASDPLDQDRLGNHVSVSQDGTVIFVGAHQQSTDVSHGGAVYVFKKISGIWTQVQRIAAGTPEINAHFGFTLSCSNDGKTLLIGEPFVDGGGTDRGNAYIFEDSGAGTYAQTAVLSASDTFDLNMIGYHVYLARDGLTAFVGAVGVSQAGSVYIFKKGSGWSSGSENQKLIASDTFPTDDFGVAINDLHTFGGTPITSNTDGSTLLIGAFGWELNTGTQTGAVYYFKLDIASGLWVETQIISNRSVSLSVAFFGYTVTITADGLTLIIGQQGDDTGGINVGRVFIFKFNGIEFVEEQSFQPSVLSVNSFFGYRVSIDDIGEYLTVTASDYDGAGGDQGASYLYRLSISGDPTIGNHTVDEQCQSLANYLPGGQVFKTKNVDGSNFKLLLRGMAGELFRADGLIHEFSQEIIPDKTVLFISEWERVVGIPDNCYKGNGTLSERRRDVLVKLASSGIQTNQDFVDLAALFGVAVTIKSGITGITFSTFPMTFPLILAGPLDELRFTIIVQFTVLDTSRFPLTFPFTFGSDLLAILECIFNTLKPANCAVIFEQV